MDAVAETLFAALRNSGMPDVPERFSVALVHQEIPSAILAQIDAFLRIFKRVMTRPAWQETVTASAPEIARQRRSETRFFSAWDFHLPTEDPGDRQLIECNDNGSGFLLAALINSLFYEICSLRGHSATNPPPQFPGLAEQVASMAEREAGKRRGSAAQPTDRRLKARRMRFWRGTGLVHWGALPQREALFGCSPLQFRRRTRGIRAAEARARGREFAPAGYRSDRSSLP